MTVKVKVSKVKKFTEDAKAPGTYHLEDVEVAESPGKGRQRAKKLFTEQKGLVGFIAVSEEISVEVGA